MRKIHLLSLAVLLSFTMVNAQESIETQEVIALQEVQKVQEVIAPVISINWESTFKNALKKAKKQNKPVLIYFTGSDWCGPCKVLDKKLFHTEKFKEYADENLVLYMADTPRNKNLIDSKVKDINEGLSRRYGQRKFPTMIMVNADGNVLGSKRGMYMIEYYYPFFDSVISNY